MPVDFWENARRELDEIKPVFMLAEWESRDLHARAFDATYAWSWYQAVFDIVNGGAALDKLFVHYSWRESAYPKDAFRLVGPSNHDVNAWEHTPIEAFGEAMNAVIVLSVVGDGIPMIYNGQEAGNEKHLAFFEKDPIEWREHPTGKLYRDLLALKKANSALGIGQWGATMIRIWNSMPDKALSSVRENEQDKVFAMMNFSPDEQAVKFVGGPFSGESLAVSDGTTLVLPPWGYRVLVQ